MNFLKLCLAVLLFATVAAVGSSSATCSNTNLKGVWGFQVGSFVGQFTADGKGNISNGSGTLSANGTIETFTFTGSYSIAKSCTGTLTASGSGETIVFNIVLDDMKKGFQIIDTTSGTVAGGGGLAQGTVTCGLTGKSETFAANIFGKIPNTGPIEYVAQVILDGKGNVSGSGTFDVNGTIVTSSFTGSYTEDSGCTGSAQVTVSDFGTLNFNLVVVNSGKTILLIETDSGTIVVGAMEQ